MKSPKQIMFNTPAELSAFAQVTLRVWPENTGEGNFLLTLL